MNTKTININKMNLLQKIKADLKVKNIRKAFADELPVKETETIENVPTELEEQAPVIGGIVNYEDLIAKARLEEKNKLYKVIDALKADKESYIQKNNDLLLNIGEKDSKIADLEKAIKELKDPSKSVESEEFKQLKTELAETKAELDEIKNKEQARALEELKSSIIAEYNGEIVEDLVTGANEEELRASALKSQEIFKGISSKLLSGVDVTPNNSNFADSFNPSLENKDVQEATLRAELDGLDLLTPDGLKRYQELREKLNI